MNQFIDATKRTHRKTELSEIYERNSFYNHEILFGYHQMLYGRWKMERIWGGGSHRINNQNYGCLEIARIGIYGKIQNTRCIESGMIRIVDNQAGSLVISLISHGAKDDLKATTVYNVYLTSDILILQEPCCDGCSTLFTRISD